MSRGLLHRREASALLVTELLKPLDRRQGGDGAEPARWSALQLRERVLDYIDVNLHDPKLTPSVIAAAHAVSVRTLYSAGNGLGMTLGGYIRHRRLARSYDELLFGADPVSVVARRWGFASPAHFGRVFQDRYGMPPSRLRPGVVDELLRPGRRRRRRSRGRGSGSGTPSCSGARTGKKRAARGNSRSLDGIVSGLSGPVRRRAIGDFAGVQAVTTIMNRCGSRSCRRSRST
jgi:AraC-like DNA-binding protein